MAEYEKKVRDILSYSNSNKYCTYGSVKNFVALVKKWLLFGKNYRYDNSYRKGVYLWQ